MGDLLSYSGMTTKLRAMRHKMLSEADFRQLEQLHSVPQAVEFLRRFEPYEEILRDIPDAQLHRGVIEAQLEQTLYADFTRLHQFANVRQKQFLNIYFLHFEAALVKRCLRLTYSGLDDGGHLQRSAAFFRRYSRLNMDRLLAARDLEHFVAATEGSQYYELLNLLYTQGDRRLADYESAIDMLYFKNLWEKHSRLFNREEKAIIEQTAGARIDLLNLSWIFRAKKYYEMTEAEIYALLIPLGYRLKKSMLKAMVEAESVDKLMQLVEQSPYADKAGQLGNEADFQLWGSEVLARIYRSSFRRHPYTLAGLSSYFFFKEREINRIINTLERIRYGINQTIYEKGGAPQ